MKKRLIVGICIVSLLSSAAFAYATSIQPGNSTLTQFVELLIKLGIIAPDKAQQAREVAKNPDQDRTCIPFNKNLRIGDRGEDVIRLRKFLAEQGFYMNKDLRDDYTEAVAAAVTAFQEKYRSEILTPAGLPNGTGYVGPATRAKLNSLLKCVPAAIKITPEALAVAQAGKSYSQKLMVHGISETKVAWTISSGSLPPGLRLIAGTNTKAILCKDSREECLLLNEALIQGIPTLGGTYAFTVRAKPENGNAVERTYKLTVRAADTARKMTVLTPNGGEVWQMGTQKTISWTDNWCNSNVCPDVEPEATIKLITYYPPCITNPCPLYPEAAPMTIARNVMGSSYSWNVGAVLDAGRAAGLGQYLIEVCGLGGCDKSDKPFKISSQSGGAPVITSISGPTMLRVGETGTWKISARDPENGSLTYFVTWGDEPIPLPNPNGTFPEARERSQVSTLTHSYSRVGTYTVSFTIYDSQGLQATATQTVTVANIAATGILEVRVFDGGIVCVTTPCEFPLPGATVYLYGANGNLIQTVETQPTGIAVFPALAPGTYTAKVTASGYVFSSQMVNIQSGTTARINLTLSRVSPGMLYAVETDKASYFPGERIKIIIRATNNTAEAKTLNWNNGCQVSYAIAYNWGSYDSETGMVCTQALTSVTIPAYGAKTWELTHDLALHPIPLGSHTLEGRVIGYSTARTSLNIYPFDEIQR